MSLIAANLMHHSDFSCTLTHLFQGCPTLPSVAAQRLGTQWQARSISPHSPAGLYLRSFSANAEYDNTRPLPEVLIERFCRRSDLLLQAPSDTLLESANDVTGLDLDLAQVQQLVNDCGPVLLDDYRQALVDYWNQPDGTGHTPWQRYADYLRQQLSNSISAVPPGTVEPGLLALASTVASYPSHEARQGAPGNAKPELSLLSLDLTQSLRLHELAGALLIADAQGGEHAPVILYALNGHLQVFASYAALQQALGRLWPALANSQPQLYSQPLTGHAFEALAGHVLEQQLGIIDRIAERHGPQDDAQHLCLALSHLTSLLDLCPKAERDPLHAAASLLPGWLHDADEHSLVAYAHSLIDIAERAATAKGATWLDGIDDATVFTYTRINAYLDNTHPGHELEPWEVEVINHQALAVALPTGQVDGTVTAVRFSLAHLAIGNWGLIRPGRVELQHKKGMALPDWLTERYLQTMVTELDIGRVYPQMLQATLLDNLPERKRRERLLADQLRVQAPTEALALALRKQLSPAARLAVSEAFAAKAGRWGVGPLGLVREAGAEVDWVANAWLIEAASAEPGEPCILYRPLSAQSLLEFPSRNHLLSALGTAGALQDDILRRLPDDVRKVYDHGGFAEPNLPGLLELTVLGVPYERPAPVTLADAAPLIHLGQAVYLGCVEETIADFRAHSATSEQTRWERWTTLGWLLLNAALPFVRGPVGTLVWLAQIAVALKQFLQTGNPHGSSQQRIALVNLLVNVGLAIFAHAAPRLPLQRPARLPGEASVSPAEPLGLPHIEAVAPRHLEQQWASSEAQLSNAQRSALLALRSSPPAEGLGMPIISGDLRGLYLHNERYWTILQGNAYQVKVDEDLQPRIFSDTQPPVPGPWLRRSSSGRWQPDLRLRLRGGMGGGPRRQALIAQRAEQRETLSRRISEGQQQIIAQTAALVPLARLVHESNNPTVLALSLGKLDAIEAFWDRFIADVEAHAALTGLTLDNNRKAQWEFQRFQIKVSRSTLLSKLILRKLASQPLRTFATAEDRAAYVRALEETTPQLDSLVSNAEAIGQGLHTLERLAGRHGTAYDRYMNAKSLLTVPPERTLLATRLLRLESNWRKFIALPNLADRAIYLLDRSWTNLRLAISQRMRLYELPQASEELSARLLHDIASQLRFALRRLENLKLTVASEPAALACLAPIDADVRYIETAVNNDLQDYPPRSSVAQLQKHTPGLIETPSHGLLLGQPRAGDETLFDVVDDQQRPIMTFRKQEEEWVPVKNDAAEPATQTRRPSLQLLFETADAEQAKARQTLSFLESSVAQHFLPVEFEELIDMHRLPLADKAATLATRLGKEPDLSPANQQRYQQRLDGIHALLAQLDSKRVTLRTRAILRQSPRQSGLEYLIEHNQVHIERLGRRRALTAVPGRPQDYIDEYVVMHGAEPLWYAHFHYTSQDAPKEHFVVGHLKTKEQRLLRGSTVTNPVTQKVEYVHRGRLPPAAAKRYFFNL
ncbi:hypothetical protein F3J45_21305 [Pantoea sp. Ap-967]|uniref:hypothetical protein n=1 Tax=Pantoea sp. Ap-967 TaxID=2608362 RepID=UPI001420816D|nr:hypothetical protein [Pantoea sp. Ap-967]NIE76980.1 hypothetical protein [Pantoea sp. Ap-967]